VAVVVGTGGVGTHAVQVSAALGAHVIAMDVDPSKLALLAGHGAAHTVDVRGKEPKDLKKQLRQVVSAHGWPARRWKVFECSGTAAGQRLAFELLPHGGVLMVVGFTMDRVELRLSNLMALHARALGNWGCVPEHYPRILELALAGQVRVSEFVELAPLGRINEVFARVHQGAGARRVVLVPGED
jgi:6-hydroxycyclohex-1-ene-1-carbonyl-CoA dehydrogenase